MSQNLEPAALLSGAGLRALGDRSNSVSRSFQKILNESSLCEIDRSPGSETGRDRRDVAYM